MKLYLVQVEYRKGGYSSLGPFKSFEDAREVICSFCGITKETWGTQFDSSYEKGKYNSTEESAYIYERSI